jgi:FAD/FMN-containing dehydrogenase
METLEAELQAGLGLALASTAEALEPYARDFSRLQRCVPSLVARATSVDEVAHVMRVAAAHDRKVIVRGAGHSSGGQVLSVGGLILENFNDSAEVVLDATNQLAEVSARSSWARVHAALTAQKRAFPVLTDYLDLSVGGTLSAAGYGARSIRHGAQIDNVEGIELVMPGGAAVRCSRSERTDLLQAALSGQGKIGVIERVWLRTMPHRRLARMYGYEFSSLSELSASLEWLESWDGPWPDLFAGVQRFQPGPTFTLAQYGFDLPDGLPLDQSLLTPLGERMPAWVKLIEDHEAIAHARTADLLNAYPGQTRIWADYMFNFDGLRKFVEYVEQCCVRPAARFLALIGLLVHRSPEDKLDFLLEPSAGNLGRVKYMVGFYFFAPPESAPEVLAMTRDLLERCLALGGRPYLYGQAQLSEEDRSRLYGDVDGKLRDLLARYARGI